MFGLGLTRLPDNIFGTCISDSDDDLEESQKRKRYGNLYKEVLKL